MQKIQSFEEFWPFYLSQHSKLWTRRLHVVGTTLGLLVSLFGLSLRHWECLPLALVIGYGFAWFSHYFIERNRPATFQYTLWSFRADMILLWRFYLRRNLMPLIFLLALAGCGTYSVLRPADNLKAGRAEIAAGFAVNTVPEFLPLFKGNLGVTDWLEIGAQYEVYTLLGEIRFGLLSSESQGIALAVGAQGGMVTRYLTRNFAAAESSFGFGPTLTVGRRFDDLEIYLGGKWLSDYRGGSGFGILSGRFGGRLFLIPGLFAGLEAGVTGHFRSVGSLAVVEAALSAGVRL